MSTSLIKARELRQGKTRETGQGLVEYMLVLILIAVAVVAIVGQLGQTVKEALYDDVACSMADASGEPLPDC